MRLVSTQSPGFNPCEPMKCEKKFKPLLFQMQHVALRIGQGLTTACQQFAAAQAELARQEAESWEMMLRAATGEGASTASSGGGAFGIGAGVNGGGGIGGGAGDVGSVGDGLAHMDLSGGALQVELS
jgi:hypothetical protein